MQEDAYRALTSALKLYEELLGRRSNIKTYDDYYAGNQALNFASKEWAEFHRNQYASFSDNWVATVADALNERLRVDGVRLPKGSQQDEDRLWGWWLDNNMESESSQGFLESIIAARSFVIAWSPDGETPVLTWEHPSQVIVGYQADGSGRKTGALKTWVDEDYEHLVYFTRHAIWKWRRPYLELTQGNQTPSGLQIIGDISVDVGGWDAWQPEEDDVWPVPNPLGVIPVVEVPNRPRLQTGPVSDVAGAVSMQDAVNLLWAYLFGAADYASLPARVVMGQEAPKIPLLDKDGQKVGEQNIPLSELQKGRILWLTGQDAKIAEWSRADLKVFTDIIEVAVGHLGGQTRTPAHYFVANKGLSNINGETLIATETPLVKKADEFALYSQKPMSEIWQIMALAVGDVKLAVAARRAQTTFANPGIRSESQLGDYVLKLRQAGYPFGYILEKLGESPGEINRILEMKRQEAYDPQFQDLVERINEDVDY